MGEDDINVDTIDEWAPILERGGRKQPYWTAPLIPCQPFFGDLHGQRNKKTQSYHEQIDDEIDRLKKTGNNEITGGLNHRMSPDHEESTGDDVIDSSMFTVYSSPEGNETKEGSGAELIMVEGEEGGLMGDEGVVTSSDESRHYRSHSLEDGSRISIQCLKITQQKMKNSLVDFPAYKHLSSEGSYELE